MKSKIISLIIIILCILSLYYRNYLINLYLSYKYPSPVKSFGLTIPIEKGFIYSKYKNSILISNPIFDKYTITIFSNFILSKGDSLEKYLEKLDYMVMSVEDIERNGIKYQKCFSVDRSWLFNVSFYYPDQKIMIIYRGTKDHYNNFKKILDSLQKDLLSLKQ